MKALNNFEKLLLIAKKAPDYLALIGVLVLVIDTGLSSLFEKQSFLSDPIRITIIASVLALLTISFLVFKEEMHKSLKNISKELFDLEELIPSEKPVNILEVIRTSKKVKILTLAGTKLAKLGDETTLNEIEKVENKQITILLGNPFSNAIISRYQKDEPESYETGLEGLIRRLCYLYTLRNKLPKKIQKSLDIRVFNNYPTCSIIQADHDIYATIYGYKLRGGDCPKIHSKTGGLFSDFLTNHFDKVYDDSIPLKKWKEKYQDEFNE